MTAVLAIEWVAQLLQTLAPRDMTRSYQHGSANVEKMSAFFHLQLDEVET